MVAAVLDASNANWNILSRSSAADVNSGTDSRTELDNGSDQRHALIIAAVIESLGGQSLTLITIAEGTSQPVAVASANHRRRLQIPSATLRRSVPVSLYRRFPASVYIIYGVIIECLL